MPAYATTTNPTALYPGDQVSVFSAESLTTGTASKQVAIAEILAGNAGKLTVEIKFSADPGAFQIDLQRADTDTADAYITMPGTSITSVNSTFYARLDLSPFTGTFVRLIPTAQPANAVTCTAKICR